MDKNRVLLFLCSAVCSIVAIIKIDEVITAISQSGQNFSCRFEPYEPFEPFPYGAILYCNGFMCIMEVICEFRNLKWDCNDGFQVGPNHTMTVVGVQPDNAGVYLMKRLVFLHVIDVQIYSTTIPGYVEEGDGLLLNVTGPNLNYTPTTIWDIPGRGLDDWRYIETQTSLEIKETSRDMNDMVITYTIEEMNNTASFDYRLQITYGPDRYLRFLPDQTFYQVNVGDELGIIECSGDCSPSCDIFWSKLSSNTSSNGSLLTVGTVTTAMNGEYICTATRTGTSQIATKSLYVVVKENCSENGKQQTSPDQASEKISLLVIVGLVMSGCSLAAVSLFILLKGIQKLKKITKKKDEHKQKAETREEPTMNYSALQRDAQASRDQYSSLEREEAFYEEC